MTTATGTARDEELNAKGEPLVAALMPAELKDKGWKLERRIVNDDEIVFLAGNEGLALYTGRYPEPDEAIEGAIILQSREDGKSLSPKQAKAELARIRREEQSAVEPAHSKDEAPGLPEQLVDQKLIRLDGGTQLRELDQATVAAYAEAKKAGAKFPAIDLFFDGKDYWPGDGFHRFFADKACGHPKTFSRIHQGTQRDAILFSLGANETHGKRRSADDKRRAVLRLLEDAEWKQNSDSWIATAANVSQPFVSSIRREIDKPAETSDPSPLRQKIEQAAGTTDLKRFESGTTRKGKDNVVRQTARIGKRPGVTKGRADISVDEPPARAVAASTNGDGLAIDVPVVINLAIKPGKNPKRGITISGRAGEGKPIFLSEFNFADLQPMPPALARLMTSLAKTAVRSAAAKASAAKPKARKR